MLGKTIIHKADAMAGIRFLLNLKVSKYRKIGSKIELTNMAGSLAAKAVFPKTK